MTAPAPPPIPTTGDQATDESLALLRVATEGIHDAQDTIAGLAAERRRIVLDLRERPDDRGGPVPFKVIATAADSTEQTIFKVYRDARRERAHDAGDHSLCAPTSCAVLAAEPAAEQADDDEVDDEAEAVPA